MEWKEKGIETIFGGVILFLGSFFVKRARPFWKELKRMSLLTDKVDALTKQAEIQDMRLRAVLYTRKEPVFICNDRGEVTFVNPPFLELTGLRTEKDAFGFGYLAVIPDEDIEMMVRENERFLKHPFSFEDEVRYLHFVTKKIIITRVRSEPVMYGGILFETIGTITEIK